MVAPKRPMALVLGAWPEGLRPEPQPCPCGAWLHPLSPTLWFCPGCFRLEDLAQEKPSLRTPLVIPLPLPLDGQGPVGFLAPRPRRYWDAFGNELLRRPQ